MNIHEARLGQIYVRGDDGVWRWTHSHAHRWFAGGVVLLVATLLCGSIALLAMRIWLDAQ